MARLDERELFALIDLLESSDSSNSDEELVHVMKERKRKPKMKGYISDVVDDYSDIEFRKNFRLNRRTCDNLIHRFEDSTYCPSDLTHGGRQPISAETHILSFLWFAGNKSCIRDVSSRFGVTESSFHRIMNRVMNFLIQIAPNVIKFPNTNEAKEQLANECKKVSGFPNVLGCIEGTYISMRTPAHKIRSTYINRHDQISITMQGICDVNRKFLDVFTGTPSKIHDARVFKLSYIHQDLQQICGNTWHILGDAAYPLREWLLTPYRDYGNLCDAKKNYNYTLSATRVLIENAFGILKGRFRQLIRTDFNSVDATTKFIISCCVLHNLCIDEGDLWEEVLDVDGEFAELVNEGLQEAGQRENALKMLGENKRNDICFQLS